MEIYMFSFSDLGDSSSTQLIFNELSLLLASWTSACMYVRIYVRIYVRMYV